MLVMICWDSCLFCWARGRLQGFLDSFQKSMFPAICIAVHSGLTDCESHYRSHSSLPVHPVFSLALDSVCCALHLFSGVESCVTDMAWTVCSFEMTRKGSGVVLLLFSPLISEDIFELVKYCVLYPLKLHVTYCGVVLVVSYVIGSLLSFE